MAHLNLVEVPYGQINRTLGKKGVVIRNGDTVSFSVTAESIPPVIHTAQVTEQENPSYLKCMDIATQEVFLLALWVYCAEFEGSTSPIIPGGMEDKSSLKPLAHSVRK